MREIVVDEQPDDQYLDRQRSGAYESEPDVNPMIAAAREPRAPASLDDVSTLIDEPTVIRDRAGTILAVYEQLDRTAEFDRAAELLLGIKHPDPGIRSGGMLVRSHPFGGRPRTVLNRMDWCSSFRLSVDYPECHRAMIPIADAATEMLDRWLPEQAAAQRANVEKIRPEYRLGDTPFTSGIVNYTSSLAYHRDGGNFPGSWNVMLTLRAEVSGGELVLPSLDAALACGDATLSMFDAQKRTHGVTRILRSRRDGYRLSIVFYALRGLCKCGSRDEEIARAQRVRTEREERRAGLIP